MSERDRFREILLGLCTLVKIINSQKRKIDTDKVSRLVKLVNIQLVQCFPWIAISPSVHRIIAHSWEVILLNNSFGLGDQSEEGLEALNKNIRHMSSKGARKDSTVSNFTDTYTICVYCSFSHSCLTPSSLLLFPE